MSTSSEGSMLHKAPYLAVSLPILVVCLARWASPTQASGGLHDDRDKAACKSVLSAMVDALPFRLGLRVAFSRPQPAAPLAGRNLPAGLRLDSAGVLVFSEQLEVCKQFFLKNRSIFSELCGAGRVSFASFIVSLGSHRRLLHDLCRVAGWVGDMLEWALLGSAPGNDRSSSAAASTQGRAGAIRLREPADPFGEKSGWICDQLLVAYWLSGRDASTGARHVSLATDKSRIGGRGKYNTVFLLPTNRAWWAPPQVGARGGHSQHGLLGQALVLASCLLGGGYCIFLGFVWDISGVRMAYWGPCMPYGGCLYAIFSARMPYDGGALGRLCETFHNLGGGILHSYAIRWGLYGIFLGLYNIFLRLYGIWGGGGLKG